MYYWGNLLLTAEASSVPYHTKHTDGRTDGRTHTFLGADFVYMSVAWCHISMLCTIRVCCVRP